MKTHTLISALSGVALAVTALTAAAENTGTWHADDELDTVILNFPGSRDKYISGIKTTRSKTAGVERNETWYADEDDNIVLNFPGSRDKYISSPGSARSAMSDMNGSETWSADEEYDNIVLNFPGSRDKYIAR